jgi:hypothetical protein
MYSAAVKTKKSTMLCQRTKVKGIIRLPISPDSLPTTMEIAIEPLFRQAAELVAYGAAHKGAHPQCENRQSYWQR